MADEYSFVEDHRRRWLDAGVVGTALAVLAATVLLRSGGDGLDLTPDGGWDWAVTALALAAVPAWLVLGDGAFDGWSQGRGLAVSGDRLVVDEVVFVFHELAAGTAQLVAPPSGDGAVSVPLDDGGSVRVRPRDPEAFSAALRDAYVRWAVGPEPRAAR
ncbi:hypothetical protein [Phycicoccus sonneratiae]|uniref:PH domain-containing protein n=1 Tax=Phycicoccus sonneratiae TaxID=2807628 RepID=A0ABS2CHZ8_9MICO|nr:hypothetical protein [Phycicoccus sonneraticus]MBM6399088.1 hypothetical protein [Phycicoccus sonneraticus]